MPQPYDQYAEAAALVDPRATEVATPRQVRRRLPAWVVPMAAPKGAHTTPCEGISLMFAKKWATSPAASSLSAHKNNYKRRHASKLAGVKRGTITQ